MVHCEFSKSGEIVLLPYNNGVYYKFFHQTLGGKWLYDLLSFHYWPFGLSCDRYAGYIYAHTCMHMVCLHKHICMHMKHETNSQGHGLPRLKGMFDCPIVPGRNQGEN